MFKVLIARRGFVKGNITGQHSKRKAVQHADIPLLLSERHSLQMIVFFLPTDITRPVGIVPDEG
jgi:hypothetical protein